MLITGTKELIESGGFVVRKGPPMSFLVRASALLLSWSCLHADVVPAADPDLPQPVDFSFADDLLVRSPFTRIVNLEETYQLTGVAYVDGQPVATVLNTQTKQRLVVTEEPSPSGLRLVAANAEGDLHGTEVELQVGDEVVAVHYQDRQISPAGGVNGSRASMASSGKKSGDSTKFRTSSLLGENGRELYSSLSPEARDKFRDIIRSRMEKHPEMTAEQTSSYAQKIFAKIKASESRAAKPTKPSKIKQGT